MQEFRYQDYHYRFKQKMPNLLELYVIRKDNGTTFCQLINGNGIPAPEFIFELFKQNAKNWIIELEILPIEKPKKKTKEKEVKLLTFNGEINNENSK